MTKSKCSDETKNNIKVWELTDFQERGGFRHNNNNDTFDDHGTGQESDSITCW